MKDSFYSIGEVSKLANVSIKALRYYDKIDLFKPAYVNPDTNYRYYTDSQLYHLDLIKSLKYIGTPLEEMKKAQELEMEELFAFYTEQEKQIREKLDFLSTLEQTISLVKKRMKRQMEYPALGEVFVLDEEEIRIIQTEAEGIGPENVLNASYSKLKTFIESADGFSNNSYGAAFSFQPYNNIDEMTYRHIFTPVLTNKQMSAITPDMEITTIPKGKYVCIAYNFSPEHYFLKLKKLIKYITDRQLTVISDVYELIIPIHYSPKKQEEYRVEMKIRIAE
ncbi:MerR family transcriptional regulator [Bacillus mojavensis]|uniref:MerR family transcriptional regulator n=1 Tax=Bacillus mojavensis TaxID=72360 RepID=UPI002DB5EA54|nr:MerR family transcriptional regulator [Bacillus mojavensis]MEC1623250.1 MerR family transcriptional regulator [Bacillus mojavensis]MEC1658761.1 MerR family transcriptional regulator [Bacillus mojavensis]